ncbi:unnamed protein product [Microthlaspi erraticum]|uniref:CCHC-type domain-containing protein n=1 Tax=Microthlaspi erraticum TaxID=1685480 RepID=A0A6D2KSN0_9BRAS|nr:unnamed protein product [Microthlaspi erraticum]
MVEEAKVLWDDLKLQFSAGNGPRVSEIRADLANCRQDDKVEAVGFAVSAGTPNYTPHYQEREKDVTCTHCGKYGHAMVDCFQIKGHPDWWGERGRNMAGRGGRGGRFGRGGGAAGAGGFAGRGRGTPSGGRANVVQVGPVATTAAANLT